MPDRVQRQSARMSKITNDGLTWSGTGCFIAMWQQWASKGSTVKYVNSLIVAVCSHMTLVHQLLLWASNITWLIKVLEFFHIVVVVDCDFQMDWSVVGVSWWYNYPVLGSVCRVRQRCSESWNCWIVFIFRSAGNFHYPSCIIDISCITSVCNVCILP